MTERDVLIAGGGIGGLAAALCCAQQGFRVQLLEQAAAFGDVGAGIQLSPNCTRVLHGLGLGPALDDIAFLPEATEIRDWRSGALITTNPLGASVRARYGYPYYHVHRADLIEVLADAARSTPAISLHSGTRVDGFQPSRDGVRVDAGGRRFEGAVLVGADGIHSTVRSALFGREAPAFTGSLAWRALVPAERLPDGLVRPVTTAWWGPGGHFVHYFVRGGTLVNCVCVIEKTGWEFESWTERGDRDELKRDFAGWHDGVQVLIDHMDPDACFKWALFDRPPMARWSQGRVTLLGDACHPTLPFMAQGAAMAIEDAAVLAGCLAHDKEATRALLQYEQLRRARTARIQEGSRRNARLFHLRGAEAVERNKTAGAARGRTLDWLYRYDALRAHELRSEP